MTKLFLRLVAPCLFFLYNGTQKKERRKAQMQELDQTQELIQMLKERLAALRARPRQKKDAESMGGL